MAFYPFDGHIASGIGAHLASIWEMIKSQKLQFHNTALFGIVHWEEGGCGRAGNGWMSTIACSSQGAEVNICSLIFILLAAGQDG